MGRGPEQLIEQGAADELSKAGHEALVESIESEREFRTEVTSSLELSRKLASRVLDARSRGALPIVLSGNCSASLGALTGLDTEDLGLVWFDAHGDFNTPETTESGYFDGMAMAAETVERTRRTLRRERAPRP